MQRFELIPRAKLQVSPHTLVYELLRGEKLLLTKYEVEFKQVCRRSCHSSV